MLLIDISQLGFLLNVYCWLLLIIIGVFKYLGFPPFFVTTRGSRITVIISKIRHRQNVCIRLSWFDSYRRSNDLDFRLELM